MLKRLCSISVRLGLFILLTETSVQAADEFKLPADMPKEGNRDVNLVQLEPTVIDEKYYTSGAAERHQKIGATLPYGAEIPDTEGPPVKSKPDSTPAQPKAQADSASTTSGIKK